MQASTGGSHPHDWSLTRQRSLYRIYPWTGQQALAARALFQGAIQAKCSAHSLRKGCGKGLRPRHGDAANGKLIFVRMNSEEIKKLFQEVRRGKLSPDEAVQKLKHLPFEDLGHSKVDHHRRIRTGMPEVIF